MNIWKSLKTAFDPPPPIIFGKLYCGFRDKIVTKVRKLIMAGLLCILWSYFPWDACRTTVQHGNWLKTYHKKTLLYHFNVEKTKVQILQYKFLDWKWPPPSSQLFRNFTHFGDVRHPLAQFEAVAFNQIEKSRRPSSPCADSSTLSLIRPCAPRQKVVGGSTTALLAASSRLKGWTIQLDN